MIERTIHGRVARLRWDDGRANTIDLELLDQIEARLDEVAGDEVAAVVLTGNGRMFSAGVDLHRVVRDGAPYLERFLPALDRVVRRLFTFPKPIVAAIDGHAIAGGLILACACDHRLAATGRARLGVPELRVGVPFPAWPLEIVRSVVAPHRLAELVLLGRTYDVERAAEMGLVDEVVAAEDLGRRALEVADEMAAIPAAAFAVAKQQLRLATLCRVDELASLEPAVRKVWSAEETRQAISAYLAQTLGKGG